MVVVQCAEEIKGVALSISGIEEDDLISAGTIVFLVAVQKVASAKIGVDVTNAI